MVDVNGSHAADLGVIQSPEQHENTAEILANSIAQALTHPGAPVDLAVSALLAQTLASIAISKRLNQLEQRIASTHRK